MTAQVTPKYRKTADRWVVDTRAAGIKKLNGARGGENRFLTKEAADDYAAVVNAAQRSGGAVTRAASGTIDAAAGLLDAKTDVRVKSGAITYRHAGNIRCNVRAWTDLKVGGTRFGDLKCTDVTTADIEDQAVPQFTVSAKTIKERLDALKQLFDLAHKQGWCSHINPARQVKLEAVRYRGEAAATGDRIERFDVAKIRAVIEAATRADDWCDGLAVAFAAQTGLRFGEQAALRWRDIDFATNRVTVCLSLRQVAKGVIAADVPKTPAARRTVFLTPQIAAALREWRVRSPKSGADDVVFITRAGHRQSSADNWRTRVLHPACDAAGIDRLRWHDLRHFFASLCLELFGGDFHRITTLLGHKSISTTRELYGHWVDDPRRDESDAAAFGAKLWR
jgi:integrase